MRGGTRAEDGGLVRRYIVHGESTRAQNETRVDWVARRALTPWPWVLCGSKEGWGIDGVPIPQRQKSRHQGSRNVRAQDHMSASDSQSHRYLSLKKATTDVAKAPRCCVRAP